MSTLDININEHEWEEQFLRNQHSIVPFGAVATGAFPKPPPLVEGVLLDRTLTMISAEPYCGKTMFSLALAIAIASGKPFLDTYAIPAPRTVLFLGQDAPSWDYAEQARKLGRGYELTPNEVSSLPLDFVLNTGVSILDPSFSRLANDWYQASNFGVIILDTMASFHNMDENDNRAMGMVMTAMKRLRDALGCAVIFSHHTAKPLGGGNFRSRNYAARGASSIAGSVDFHYSMSRPAQNNGEDLVEVSFPKGRGNEAFVQLSQFTIEEESHDEGVAIKLRPGDQSNGRREFILDALRQGKTKRSWIAQHVRHHIRSPLTDERLLKAIDNDLQVMAAQGKVRKINRGEWGLC